MDDNKLNRANALKERIKTLREIVGNPKGWSLSYKGMVIDGDPNRKHVDHLHVRAMEIARQLLTRVYEEELAKLEVEYREL